MKHKPKRFLALLLCVLMIASVLPVGAMADAPAYTAKIGETNYRFLQQAVNAVKDGETITLLRDCSENPLISRNVTFTLDKGSFTFSGEITKGSNNTDIAVAGNVYTVKLVDKGGWAVTSTVDSEIKAYIQKAWEKAQTGVFIAGHPITATGWYESDGFPATEQTGTVYVDLTNHTVTLKNAQIAVSSQPVTTRLEKCPRASCTADYVKLNNEIPYEGVLCLTDIVAYNAGSGACRLNPFGHYYMPRGYKSNYNGNDYFATIGLALLTEDDWSVTVEGTNSINVNAAFDHPDSTGNTNNGIKSGDAFGIYAKGALTLSGTGSLTEVVINNGRDSGRNSSNSGGAFDCAAGLYAASLNITSGTYDITTKNTTGKVYTGADANGNPSGETEKTPSNQYGAIFADGNITISGNTTNVTADDALLGGSAIKAGSMSWPMGSGKITISGGANVTAKEEVASDSMTAGAIVATNGIEIDGTNTVVTVESAYSGVFNYQNAITINNANVTVTVPQETDNESLTAYAQTATVNSGKYKKAIPDSYIAEGYYQIYEDDTYYHITNKLPSSWDAACGPNVYSGDGAGDAAIAACDVYDDWSGKYDFYDVYLRQNSSANIENAAVGDVITVYLAEGVSYTGKVTGTGVKAEEKVGEAVTYQGISFTPHIFTVVVDQETAAAKIVTNDGTETYYATMKEAGTAIGADNTLVLLKDATSDYELNYVNFAGKSYSIDFNGHKLNNYSLYNYTNNTTVKLLDSSASGAGGFAGTTSINVQRNAIISGGTYDASKIKVNNANATLAITGGYFTNSINVSNGALTITGGYYTADMSSYVAPNYSWLTLPTTDPAYALGYRYTVKPLTIIVDPVVVEGDDIKIGDKEIEVKGAGGVDQPTVQQAAEAINNMLDNKAVTTFEETNVDEATKKETVVGGFNISMVLDALNTEAQKEGYKVESKVSGDGEITVKGDTDQKVGDIDVEKRINVELEAAKVEIKNEGSTTTTVNGATFDVKPTATITVTDKDGEVTTITAVIPNEAIAAPITFRIPVDAGIDEVSTKVWHSDVNGEFKKDFLGVYPILIDEATGEKYIELSASKFSYYTYENIKSVTDGSKVVVTDENGENIKGFDTLQDALNAVGNNGVIYLLEDNSEPVTIPKAKAPVTFDIVTNGFEFDVEKIAAPEGYYVEHPLKDGVYTIKFHENECVAKTDVAPQDGTFVMTIGGNNVGNVTLKKVSGGWYIMKGEQYIVRDGNSIKLSTTPQVWQYSYGKFFQTTTEKISRGWTILNILFGRKTVTNDYYLASNGGNGFAINSTAEKANVVLTKVVSKAHCDEFVWKSSGTGKHAQYCADCGKATGNTGTCTYVNGECQVCGAPDPKSTGMFDINVKVSAKNFLFFKLYTADVFVTSDIVGIKNVKIAQNEALEYSTGKIISTRPIDRVIIVITTYTNDIYSYSYNVKTGVISPYDLLK